MRFDLTGIRTRRAPLDPSLTDSLPSTEVPGDPGPSDFWRHAGRLAAFAVILAGGSYLLVIAWPFAQWGPDAHAYWSAWHASALYPVGTSLYSGTYVYPPPLAQLLRPAGTIPWEFFRLIWGAIAFGAFAWLLQPLTWPLRVAMAPLVVLAVMVGNIEWLLALVCVAGFRYPATWAAVIVTKVSPGIGILWFAVLREWKRLGSALLATSIVLVISVAADPSGWTRWLELAPALDAQTHAGWWPGALLPFALRLPVALAVVAWGALTRRRYVLPVGMMLASPDINPPVFALLAAVPRLASPSSQSRDQR